MQEACGSCLCLGCLPACAGGKGKASRLGTHSGPSRAAQSTQQGDEGDDIQPPSTRSFTLLVQVLSAVLTEPSLAWQPASWASAWEEIL